MDYIIHAANILFLASYLVRDIFWLRVITIIAISSLIPYYYNQIEPLWAPIAWNILFILINSYQVYVLWLERKPVFLTSEEQGLYSLKFESLSPKQFKRLISVGHWKEFEPSVKLTEEGVMSKNLMLISSGESGVFRSGQEIAKLGPGNFVGEMSFMTGETVSADVRTKSSNKIFSWAKSDLDQLFKKSPEIHSEIQKIIGFDLVEKLKV